MSKFSQMKKEYLQAYKELQSSDDWRNATEDQRQELRDMAKRTMAVLQEREAASLPADDQMAMGNYGSPVKYGYYGADGYKALAGVESERVKNALDRIWEGAAKAAPTAALAFEQTPKKPRIKPDQQDLDNTNKFNTLVGAVSKQLGRRLSDDESGFLASGIYNGNFNDMIFNYDEGTFTKRNANSRRPLKDLVSYNMGDFAAENTFQKVADARGIIARVLEGSFLTEKGVKAFSE
jgi:hypothetical protein